MLFKGFRAAGANALPFMLLLMLTIICSGQTGCGTAPVKKEKAPYAFFPPPPDEPRYQFLVSYSDAKDIGEQKRSGLAEHVLGVEEEEKFYEIIKPFGVAMDSGVIYACDTQQQVVDVLDIANRKFSFLGLGPAGKLRKPINVYVDADGKKYVTDTLWNRVLIYDEDGEYYNAVGNPDALRPADALVIGDSVLISDMKDNEIEVWDKNTQQYKGVLGESIGEKAELRGPIGLAKDSQNNIYVIEGFAFRVSVLDEEGHLLRTFGAAGDSFGQFARPKGIAVDGDGRIYVVDAAFANVQVFDNEGKLLTFIGGSGGEPGQLILPASITIDYDNVDLFRQYVHPDYDLKFLILVTSQYGPRKVSVYGFVAKKG